MIQFNAAYLSRNKKSIFTNFTLGIRPNEKVLIQGKSGIGKSTLFKVLLGFEPLDRGKVLFNGQKISKTTIRRIRGMIFYLSQDIDLKNQQVQHLLSELQDTHDIQNGEKKISKWMALMELSPKILNQQIRELSGGERQRLGLLIGLILDRPVWLLDEPTSALDDAMKKKVSDHIMELDKTVVIISHDAVWKNHPGIRIERWT